jgi:zinc transporter 1
MGRTHRLAVILALTAAFMVVELIAGAITRSAALMADAFHMISDVLGQAVGLSAIRVAKLRRSERNTFGWTRMEVLGGLVNGVFMFALCLSIVLSSLERFFQPEEIEHDGLLLVVGIVGLAVNVVGLFLSGGHGHGHSHGGSGHGHSHGGSGHGHSHGSSGHGHSHGGSGHGHSHGGSGHGHSHGGSDARPSSPSPARAHVDHDEPRVDHNMRGVFLHVLGDALGSLAVIVSALVRRYASWQGAIYLDPALGLFIATLLLVQTVPLIKRTSIILLQGTPQALSVADLQRRIEAVDGVVGVHELHVWQLVDDKAIASVHVRCRNGANFMRIAADVKRMFHEAGVHSSTVQPEFVDDAAEVDDAETESEEACLLHCKAVVPTSNCARNQCCEVRQRAPRAVTPPAPVPAIAGTGDASAASAASAASDRGIELDVAE